MPERVELVAATLGLSVVRRLAGGEFGATLVRNPDGDELVLKVLASERLLNAVARGAGLANRLRTAGYPAPEYVGTGTLEGLTWALQRPLTGSTPEVLDEGHAGELLSLARWHVAFAEDTYDWPRAMRRRAALLLQQLPDDTPKALAAELSGAIERSEAVELRRGDVVHSDFHHRNFLAIDGRVTGVFDWEFATPGDWRFDAVTLAFWSHMVPERTTHAARELLIAHAREVCEPAVFAFMSAFLALNNLDFQGRHHPENLAAFIEALIQNVSHWWQEPAA